MIVRAAKRAGISPALLAAVVEAESQGDPRARSSAGALGLTQLMPGTAKELGVTDPFDPAQNLAGGAKYLRSQLSRFGSEKLALAAYNAGPGAVQKAGNKVPQISETQAYVQKVLQLEESYKANGLSDITAADTTGMPIPAGFEVGQEAFTPETTMSLLIELLQPSQIAKSVMAKAGPTSEKVAASSDHSILISMLQTQIAQQNAATAQAMDTVPTTAEDVTAPGTSDKGLPQSPNAITDTALTQLGVPYKWGGNEWGTALDCSGLTQQTFARNGVRISRTTYDQYREGIEVNPNALQPGDAVFFHKGPRGPEHVGIYIGNDQFVQAPQTGDRVKVSQLSTYGGFMGARRYK
jgi:cell wall-associated NlpC family hydrolase